MIEKTALESKKRLTKKPDIRPLSAFFAVFASLAVIFLILGVSPFGERSVLMSDLSAQYAPYLVTMRNKILHGGSLSYSFEIGMGKNFLGILAYYLTSPLNLITLIFPASHISDAILLIVMLKLSFAGAFMTALLDFKFREKTKMTILFGMIYALSSYSMSFIFNIMWLDGFALFPLLILMVEKFSRDIRQAWKLLLVLVLLFVSNYYTAYMIGIFSFFYLIGTLEYRLKGEEKATGSAGKVIVSFILISICAAMISAALLVPAGLDTIRNGDASSTFDVSMDAPFRLIALVPQLFITKLTDVSANLPFIFSSIAVTELVLLFFLNPSVEKALKIRAGIGLGVGIVSFLLPPLNAAWHLFDNPNWFLYRYSFLFIFGTILIAFYSFLKLKALRNSDYIKALGVLFLLLLLGEQFGGIAEKDSMYFQNLAMLLLVSLCLFGMSKEKWPDSLSNLKKWRSGIVIPIVLAEIVFLAPKVTVGAIWNDTQINKSFSSQIEELNDLTASIDRTNGARTEMAGVLGSNIDSLNLSSYTKTKGIGAFCSMSNKTQHRFLKQLGYCTNYNYFSTEHRNVILPSDSVLGVRYIVSNRKEISGLTPVGSSARYTLFENPYAADIAFLAEETAGEFSAYDLETKGTDKDYFVHQEKWLESLTGVSADNVYTKIQTNWEVFNAKAVPGDTADLKLEYDLKKDGKNLEDIKEGHKDLTAYLRMNGEAPIVLRTEITAINDSPIYLSVPFLMRGAPISVYCNGQQIYREASDSYYSVIVDIPHQEGEKLTLEIRCDDDILACFDPTVARCSLSELEKQTALLNSGISGTSVKDGKVTFEVDAQSRKLLIATVPYEQGWTVTIDGQKAEITSYQDAFLSFPVDAGHHVVTLQFTPPGARIGVIISALGCIAGAALAIVLRKNGTREQQGGDKVDREEHS